MLNSFSLAALYVWTFPIQKYSKINKTLTTWSFSEQIEKRLTSTFSLENSYTVECIWSGAIS
ncbi:MAG: hypothetical protein O9295_24580 [Microcystis sp. LE18-22.4A]|nr:hypothetical protein [Microcystis sp. LE18-22.4A]